MIYIDRSRVAEPKEFEKYKGRALKKLQAFYKQKKNVKMQRKASFDYDIVHLAQEPLGRLFHGKCAYCESFLESTSEHQVDYFRPRSNASNMDKSVSPEHYWWLSYEWKNLYSACPQCNRQKGNYFPVKGERAKAEARGDDLSDEHRLLLDPCQDNPSQSLQFEDDGTVLALDELGETSIEIFGLNRKELVHERQMAIDGIRPMVDDLVDLVRHRHGEGIKTGEEEDILGTLYRGLYEEIRESSPYAGSKRQYIERMLGEDMPTFESMAPKLSKLLFSVGSVVATAALKGAKAKIKDYFFDAASLSPPTPSSVNLTSVSVWIERVEIKNFMAIEELTLSFPEGSSNKEPWLILIGENGVGKSTILKALALVFMSKKGRNRYYPDASVCMNNKVKTKKGGYIRVFFTDSDEPVELSFAPGRKNFDSTGKLPKIPLLAYGSTRMPPLRDGKATVEPKLVRAGNLFSPHVPLCDAEPWLTDTKEVSSDKFGMLAASLRTILDLSDDQQIARRKGNLLISLPHRPPLKLRSQSDGYQSVVALTTDIMLNLAKDWSTMENAEGTVLIDEIECHLHPSWKMRIIKLLREVFPRVRFIVTTHEPLCLQNTDDGEVHRLYLDRDSKSVAIEQVNVPSGLRADQLLTGPWFGMSTTLDEDTTNLYREHGKLLYEGAPESDPKRIDIENKLSERFGSFQETAVERMVYGIAVDIIHKKQKDWELTEEGRKELRETIMETLNDSTLDS